MSGGFVLAAFLFVQILSHYKKAVFTYYKKGRKEFNNNSTIIQLDIKNHAFLRKISDKISAFRWSASSMM